MNCLVLFAALCCVPVALAAWEVYQTFVRPDVKLRRATKHLQKASKLFTRLGGIKYAAEILYREADGLADLTIVIPETAELKVDLAIRGKRLWWIVCPLVACPHAEKCTRDSQCLKAKVR